METSHNSVLTITINKKSFDEKFKIMALDELHNLILDSNPVAQGSRGTMLMKNVLPIRFHPLITNMEGNNVVVGMNIVHAEEVHFQWGQLVYLEQADLNYCIDSGDAEMFYMLMFSSMLHCFGKYFRLYRFDVSQLKYLCEFLHDMGVHPIEEKNDWFNCKTVSDLLQTNTKLAVHFTETYMEIYFPIVSEYRKTTFYYTSNMAAYDDICVTRDYRKSQPYPLFSTSIYFENNIRELNEISWLLDNTKSIISEII